jgi:hypothetical protein
MFIYFDCMDFGLARFAFSPSIRKANSAAWHDNAQLAIRLFGRRYRSQPWMSQPKPK